MMTSDKTLELEEGFEDVLGSRAVLKKVRLSHSLSYTFKIHEKKIPDSEKRVGRTTSRRAARDAKDARTCAFVHKTFFALENGV